jgi:hypothetical protein
MNAIRLFALLGAVLLTAGELVAFDYYTTRLGAHHTSQAVVAPLMAQR